MNLRTTLIALALLAVPAAAQTQLVRGEVDGIQNTNRFQLKCTTVRLTSATQNLQALHDLTRQNNLVLEMQVVDTSGNGTSLEVVSASAVTRQHDMGNLRIGRSETWEVFAAPGSRIWTFFGSGADTRYLPLGSFGTWILGPSAVPFMSGVASPGGSLRTQFTMPNVPGLVGVAFSSQSVVEQGGAFQITNPECKTVRAD